MLKIGTKIKGSHGTGKIVGYNGTKGLTNEQTSHELFPEALKAGIVSVDMFYPADRYPYIVQFDDGYKDVYSDQELQVVK